jgi:hypothetical protein
MQKKFTIGLIALLGISLFLFGCSYDSSNYDSTTPPTADATELVKALGEDKAGAEGSTLTLTAYVPVMNLSVKDCVTLDTVAKTLSVSGKLFVSGSSGKLDTTIDIAYTFAATTGPAIVVPQPILQPKFVFPSHS